MPDSLFLRQPRAIVESWSKTEAFAKELKRLTPIYLYYWSPEDRAIIANRCEVNFAPDTGITFSFFNPLHAGPDSHVKIGELQFSGQLRLVDRVITFEVFSHQEPPEPASGIGTPGTPTALGIARGSMVGFQTRAKGHNEITLFKFILLSDPHPSGMLQKTDRIPSDRVPDPLATYFKDELTKP